MTEDNTTEEESRDAGDTLAGLPYRARTWHGHWGAERIADGRGFYGDRYQDARDLCEELNRLARERDGLLRTLGTTADNLRKARERRDILTAERDAAREEAEAMKSRLKWAEDAVAKLEADIAAGSERAVETSPIADGGRYSLMAGETYKVHNEIFLRHATDEDGWFWACASDPGEAEDFCTRLNRERDGRVAAEAELAALKAQHANGSGIPNGSGGDGEDLYPVEETGGRWYVRMAPEMWLMAGTEFSAYAFSKTLKELDAARFAAEKRAEEYKRERDAFSGANEHLNKANRELRERLLAEDTLGITVEKTDDRMSDAAFRDHAAISIAGVMLNAVKIGSRSAADSVAEASMDLAESLVAARALRDAKETSPSA